MKQRKQALAEKRKDEDRINVQPRSKPPLVTRVEARMWDWGREQWGDFKPAILVHPPRVAGLS